MKHRKYFLIAAAILLAIPSNAKQIAPDEATTIARDYLTANAPRRLQGINQAQPQLSIALAATSADDRSTDYYVLNNGTDRGFIVVAGDDRAVEVLGYCDQGTFDPANVPDGLQVLLDEYAAEMRWLRANPTAAKAEAQKSRNPVVAPLIYTNWGQNTPFNDLCPVVYNMKGEQVRAVTGCVATAAAQLMYYHRWPKEGKGTNSYFSKAQRGNTYSKGFPVEADFNHPYDWDNMLENYTESNYTDAQAKAVAQLMYDAGAAASMNYGTTSGTSAYFMMTALREHFSYSKDMRFELRSTKTITEWENLIFEELNNKRPILYSGFTATGGHTFILDGYNADGYFHFNWGWNSKSNGYFIITSLNPRNQGTGSYEGGYNSCQTMVTGMRPDDGTSQLPDDYVLLTCDKFTPNEKSVKLGSTTTIDLEGVTGTGAGYGNILDITHAFVLTDQNDKIVEVLSKSVLETSIHLGSRYTYTTARKNPRVIDPSTNLADGDYHLHYMYKNTEADETEYKPYDHSSLVPGYWIAHVENGVMTFTQPKAADSNLKVVNFDYPEKISVNTFFNFSVTLSNDGEEFYGNINIDAKRENDEKYTSLLSSLIDLPTDGQITIKTTSFAPRDAGNYKMVIRDDAGNIIDGPRDLTVTADENFQLLVASQLTVGSYNMFQEHITASVDVTNTGQSDFNGALTFFISRDGKQQADGATEMISIPKGATRTVNYVTRFEGQPGVEYVFYASSLGATTDELKAQCQAPFKVEERIATETVADLLTYGEDMTPYRIADNLTIAEAHEPSLFVTDGLNNWLEITDKDNFAKLKEMEAFEAGTVFGRYGNADGNPTLQLLWLPAKGEKQEFGINELDLTTEDMPLPNQVVELEGYYAVVNGVEMLRYGADDGNGFAISLQWLDPKPSLIEGSAYRIHGVAKVQVVNDEASYIIYATRQPSEASGIGAITGSKVSISQANGVLTVKGASQVATYSVTGALLSRNHSLYLAPGIYIVVADGRNYKINIR